MIFFNTSYGKIININKISINIKKKGVLRQAAFLFIMLLFLVSASGCAKEQTGNVPNEVKDNDSIQIGLSMDSFVIERWQRDRDLFVSKAQELGAEVNVQNANGILENQIKQIEYFIDKKVDVIVIVAIDADALGDAVANAKKEGIKVIAYDRLIRNADVDLYISFDNEEVGVLMAYYLRKAIGINGSILQINGSPTDNNVEMLDAGFERTINQSNLEIAKKYYADNWLAEKGFQYTSEYLETGAVPDGIMCGNDGLATQAIKCLSENRLAGDVIVVGQDADLDACQRIVEGTQYMTVYKPVELEAQTAATMAVKLAKGEALEIKDVINDGSNDVPYEKLEPIAVTKENMDEVIIGKFHQKNEVYMNIK